MTIPTRISIEQINQLLQGFYHANALQNQVSTKDAAQRTKVNADIATRNVGFLSEAGFLVKEGPGYKLTELGAEYAQWLSWKNEDEASKSLAKILKQFDLSEKVIHFVKVAGPIPKEDVISRAAVIDGAPRTPGYKKGATTFIDLLIYSGLLSVENDNVTTGMEKIQVGILDQKDDARIVESAKRETTRSENISIVIQIDSQTNPDQLRKVIRILKQELRKWDLDKPEDTENT